VLVGEGFTVEAASAVFFFAPVLCSLLGASVCLSSSNGTSV